MLNIDKIALEIFKESILKEKMTIGQFEVRAEPNGSNYDVFIYPENDPTKKYRVKENIIGAKVLDIFKTLEQVLKSNKAIEFVKDLKFFKVDASKDEMLVESALESIGSYSEDVDKKCNLMQKMKIH